MGDVRRGVVGLSVGVAMLVLAPLPSSPAAGSCAAPQLSVGGDFGGRDSPVTLHRGEELTVDGRYFVDGCDDTGGGDAFGCSEDEPEPAVPLEDAQLELLDSARSTSGLALGVADADDHGRIAWTVTVPADAPLGRGVLRVTRSGDLYVVVQPSDARRTGGS